MKLSNMKLAKRLTLGFGFLSALTVGIAAVGYWSIDRLTGHLNEVGVVRLSSILGLGILNEAQIAIEASERTLLLPVLDSATLADQQNRLQQYWKNVDKGWGIYEPLPQTKEEASKWK